jgi:hypothetical protein
MDTTVVGCGGINTVYTLIYNTLCSVKPVFIFSVISVSFYLHCWDCGSNYVRPQCDFSVPNRIPEEGKQGHETTKFIIEN